MKIKSISLFSFYVALFIGLILFVSMSAATIGSSMESHHLRNEARIGMKRVPPGGFCQAKTDYDPNVTCSEELFIAENMEDLQSYQTDFGLSDNKYKNLRIRFPLSGEELRIHSPCEISTREGVTHIVKNLCLDGRKKVAIGAHSVFASERIHILGGDSIIHGSSVLQAKELEVFVSGKMHINKGVRLEIERDIRLASTPQSGSFIAIRLGPGSVVEARDLTIEGNQKINLNGTSIRARGLVSIDSQGSAATNHIFVTGESEVRGNRISMTSGNNFMLRERSVLRSEQNMHVEARGCLIDGESRVESATHSGSCLSSSSVNQIPTVAVGATPLLAEVPFQVNFSGSGSLDPDGQIASYTWTFPDGSTLSGESVQYEFVEPGAHIVTLTLTDDNGASAEEKILVIATKDQASPVASFTFTSDGGRAPGRGLAPLRVSFDGSASSDPDGDIVAYQWIFSDGLTLEGGFQERVFDRAGEYQVSLRVTDNDGITHQTEASTIYVETSNLPPVLTGSQTFAVRQNKSRQFTLNGGSDPDGDLLTYSIVNDVSSGVLSGCLNGTNQLTCTYTPMEGFVGQVIFSYKANDKQRDSETVSVVTLNIAANMKPVARAGSNQNAISGGFVTLDGSGSSDAEGDALTYRWELPTRPIASRARLANPSSATPAFIADRDGMYIARLIVNDGDLDSLSSEVTITVTGEANATPVLSSITTPQTIEMGTELRLTLSATDTDTNDTLTFLATDLPENASLDGATGKFRFQPSPSQVGSHTVTFMVMDGKESHSQDVVLTVQAPATDQVTALKSRVLDANAYSADGSIVPIAGVTISVEGSTVTTTTDANGYFTISGIPHGAKIVSLDASGLTAPNGHKYADFSGRLKIMQNVLNRPHRDYMLPRMNPAHMSMVNPASDTMVTNSDIGVTMMVPAKAARNPDGTMYDGPLSISMVPSDATPRELPEIFTPSFIITLQPVGVNFETPVEITFPNTDNLTSGAVVDLFSLSERGGFEKVGLGRVSEDGQTISVIEGGIRSTTWHFVTSPEPEILEVEQQDDGEDSNNNTQSQTCDGSSDVCVATGVLGEEHGLSSFNVSGLSVSPSLVYKNTNSLESITLVPTYRYEPVVVRSSIIPVPTPRMMSLSFDVGGRISSGTFFGTAPLTGRLNMPFEISTKVLTRGLKTGVYQMTSRLSIRSGTAETASERMRKDTRYLPVVSPETEFGMGWRFEDLQSLHGINGELDPSHERVMLLLDNFEYLVFERNPDGEYIAPKGDYSTLTAIPAPVGGFTRKTRRGDFYIFNSNGLLVGREDRQGRRTYYSYTLEGKLLQVKYDNGGMTNFTYGSNGLVESITNPGGRVTRLVYDDRKNLIRITDPDGTSRGFEYGSNHALLAQIDKMGRAKTYAYDMRGNVTQSVREDQSLFGVVSSSTRAISEGLGTEEKPFMVKVGEKVEGQFFDGNGNQSLIETNEFGAITKIADALGGEQAFVRDENNNITKFQDKNGNVYETTYDAAGNILSQTSPESRIIYEYMEEPSDNFDQPISIRDGRGRRTYFEYDSFGNVTQIRNREGHITTFIYKDKHLLQTVRNHETHTGAHYEYDSNGNIVTIKDLFHQTLATFTYDSVGNVLTQTDALGRTATFTYDSLNRVLTQTDAKNGVVNFAYDSSGNLLSVNDQRGNITSFEYDNLNRVIKRTDPLSRIERFSYDRSGNLITRTDRNGAQITYFYDALNRLVSKLYPDGTEDSYSYDAVGNMLSAQDSDSMISYAYDRWNRLISVSTLGSQSQPSVTLTYNYDRNSNVVSLVDSVTRNPSRILYEYDRNDNLVKMGHSSIFDSNFVRFNYDSIDRVTGMSYPNQVNLVSSYVFGKPNQLSSVTYGKSQPDDISSFSYGYNLNDYVTSLNTSRGNLSVNTSLSYGYDVTNQLTSATRPTGTGSESFTYDIIGNRLRKGDETEDSSFNVNNQLTNDKKYSYSYDKNGNLLTRTNLTTNAVREYQWDYENRLIKVLEKVSSEGAVTKTIVYRYDPFGRRIQKDVDGVVTKYVYDRNSIFLEFDKDNELSARYVHGNNIDEPVRMERRVSPHRDESFVKQQFLLSQRSSG